LGWVRVRSMPQENADETYSVIYAALKHPVRRRILRILNEEELTYTQMLNKLDLDTGYLNYYLESLGELLAKTSEGKYRLSEFGKAAMGLMSKVEDTSNDKKEIAKLRISKRRLVLILQAIAVIALVISSLTFFNIKYESSGSSATFPPVGVTLLQPNETAQSNSFVLIKDFRANTSLVQYKVFLRIDITTNATLWIQLLGGVGGGTPIGDMNQFPEGAYLLFNEIRTGAGPTAKVNYAILVPISPKEPGYYRGSPQSDYKVRIANLGTFGRATFPNNTASITLQTEAAYIEETGHPYYYYGVAFLTLAIITAVLPYLPALARKTTKTLHKNRLKP